MKHISLGWILGFFAVTGAVAGGVTAITQLKLNPFLLPVFISIVVLPLSLIWWRKTDEGVREAHKWSWFWGGGLGMVAALVVLMLDFTAGSGSSAGLGSVLFGISDVEFGALFTVAATSLGYMLAWALWWLRHR